MKNIINPLLLVSCCALFVISLNSFIQKDLQEKHLEALPKLPLYVGTSYHILYGNPKNQNSFDPGFYQNIFDFSYTRNQTTYDSRFLIPDQTTSFQADRCVLTSSYGMSRGTQSYQKDLKVLAKAMDGPDRLNSKAFTMSKNFQKIYNLTSNQKSTVTQVRAECQIYEIFLSKVFQAPLTVSFKNAAIQAYTSGDWSQFIQNFGTHYVTQMLVGGRAIQQTVYSYQGIQKLGSVNVKLNDASWASFAKYFNDTDFNYNNYSRQINYSQLFATQRTQFYVSGQPSKNGDIAQWQANVISNPLPLFYNMSLLNGLFDRIADSRFDAAKAANQFQDAVSKLCDKLGCKSLTPDFPQPARAYTVTQNTSTYSTAKYCNSLVGFSQYFNTPLMDLRKINIRWAKYVDNLQLIISDGVTAQQTNSNGGQGGELTTWEVPNGQYINQIQINSYNVIDALRFRTNKGNTSPKFGGPGGNYTVVNLPQDYKIIGYFGRYGYYHPNSTTNPNVICQLGFTLAKTIYPQSSQSTNQSDNIITSQ